MYYGIKLMNSIMMQFQRNYLLRDQEQIKGKINYNIKEEFLIQIKLLSYQINYQVILMIIKRWELKK